MAGITWLCSFLVFSPALCTCFLAVTPLGPCVRIFRTVFNIMDMEIVQSAEDTEGIIGSPTQYQGAGKDPSTACFMREVIANSLHGLLGVCFLCRESGTWTGIALIHFLPHSICSSQNQSVWFKTWTFKKTRQQWVLASAGFCSSFQISQHIIGGGGQSQWNPTLKGLTITALQMQANVLTIIGYIWLWQIVEQIPKSPTEGALYLLNCESRFAMALQLKLKPAEFHTHLSVESVFVCDSVTNSKKPKSSSCCWVSFSHSCNESQSSDTLLMSHHYIASHCLII